MLIYGILHRGSSRAFRVEHAESSIASHAQIFCDLILKYDFSCFLLQNDYTFSDFVEKLIVSCSGELSLHKDISNLAYQQMNDQGVAGGPY